MDPISGMVTTIEKPKKVSNTKKVEPKPIESRSSSDLSLRLAAVMAEKNKNKTSSPRSSFIEVVEKDTFKENSMTTESTEKGVDSINNSKEVEAKAEIIPKEEKEKEKLETEPQKDENKSEIEPEEKEKITVEEKDPLEKLDTSNTTMNKTDVSLEPTSLVDTTFNTAIATATKISDVEKDKVLEQREKQLLQVMENITKLHDQMQQIQEDAEKNESALKSKISSLEKEAESTTSTVSMTKNIKRLESLVEDLQKQISSKDEKIQGLMLEGEKLSKVELRHSTTIKKLRLEKTEGDKTIADLTKKLEKSTLDLSQASEKGTKQTESEKKLQESVKLLSDLTEQQTKHINKLESEKITNGKKHTETEASLKKALDSIENERVKAKLEAEQVNAAALEKEIKANDRLHKELTKMKENSSALEEKLRKEIRELQIALQTVEEQAGLREDELRKDVADLQTRLQQSDNKMDDISTSVDEATAPLLRQIEELQTQHALAIKNRDQAEQSMILRMQNVEAERKKAIEKDEKLQQDIQSLTQRIEELERELETSTTKIKALESQQVLDDETKKDLQEKIDDLIKEKKEFAEKELKDQEGLKAQYQRLMKEKLNEEKKQFEIRLKAERANNVQEVNNITTHNTSPPSISSRSSFDSSSTTPVSSTILVERLQANIRQLENQLSFYQTQLQSSSQSRDELSDEVLNMSQEIEKLRKDVKKSNELDQKYQQLNGRYQTLLELLGERTEEVEELKADLIDVKEMYKSQILELVQNK